MAKKILRKLALIYGPLLLIIIASIAWYYLDGNDIGIVVAAIVGVYWFMAIIALLAEAAYYDRRAETPMARAYFFIALAMATITVLFFILA